jgi:hypothetical protein
MQGTCAAFGHAQTAADAPVRIGFRYILLQGYSFHLASADTNAASVAEIGIRDSVEIAGEVGRRIWY